MLKVNEAIKSNYLLFDANGNPATGKTVTASVYDETDTYYSAPAVSEIASTGIYQASFTPDTLGEWTIIFDCTDPNATDAMTYFIGMGQEPDILAEVAGLNGDAMRGTDSAALASVCTEVRLAHLNADISSRSSHTAANVRAETCLTGDGADSIGKILFDLNNWWKNGGRLDNLLDAIPTTVMRGTDNAALAATALTNITWTDAKAGYLTGNAYTRLGAPSGVSVSADIAANLAAITALNNITAANVRQSVCLTGDTANSIGKILYEIYINRLTSTRAGYLDTNIGSRSSHNAAAIWSVGTRALTDKAGFTLDSGEYTNIWNKNISAYSGAGYAGTYLKTVYDDWLNGGRLDLILDNIKSLVDSAEATGPFSYLDAGGEQTVKEDTLTTRRHIDVEVSNRNMAQTGTFRLYRKVDGSNYDLYTSQAVKVVAGSDRAWDAGFITNQAWKLTYEEDSDEGAARNIPYNVITQVIE